jgi:hypothetical protein
LKSALLTQETKSFNKVDRVQVFQNPESSYEHIEEYTVDCPDCFDTMIKIYEIDKIRYQCENCDLIIPDIEVQIYE